MLIAKKIDRRNFFQIIGLGLSYNIFHRSGFPEDAMFINESFAPGTMNIGIGTMNYIPPYINLHKTGELKRRATVLFDIMRKCTLCPRECNTDRLSGQRGDCKANGELEISSVVPHYGEEPELVGKNGSGTIFFTNCPLHCVFCINYEISHYGKGQGRSVKYLAEAMLRLQKTGCHNINLVTPGHYLPHIISALDLAASRGLNIPIVYNSSGWEKLEMLRLLDGVVDIYLPDFKYFDSKIADKYSPGASSYPELTKKAIIEMNRQVGVAKIDESSGLISRGLMVRHLVMPNNISSSEMVMKWIGENLPKDTYINIMSQYRPTFKAGDYPLISRAITPVEYKNAISAARKAGLTKINIQG